MSSNSCSDDDFDVTPAMRAYLAAFDAWLKYPSRELEDARAEALTALRRSRLGKRLSAREEEVLLLRVAGLDMAAIAGRLGVSVSTVKKHAEHTALKVGTGNPFRLALWAVRRGLVEP